jgi:hypothetical protein
VLDVLPAVDWAVCVDLMVDPLGRRTEMPLVAGVFPMHGLSMRKKWPLHRLLSGHMRCCVWVGLTGSKSL